MPLPYENGVWKTKDEYEAALNTVLAWTVAADDKKIHNFTGGGAIYAVGSVSLEAARIYDAYSSGEGAAVTGSYANSGSINDLQNTTDYQLQ